MYITKLDHFVLTVRSIPVTVNFYTTVLGMEHVVFSGNRSGLAFGDQRINLHEKDKEFEPHAKQPTPGSADLCFLTNVPLDQVIDHVQACGEKILAGPVKRQGATGEIISVYLRDPDGNLIEIAGFLSEQVSG